MNTILNIVLIVASFVVTVICTIAEFKVSDKKAKKLLVIPIVAAVITMLISISSMEVPNPEIDHKADNSLITISAEKGLSIEYRVLTGKNTDKWIKYKEPFSVEKDGIIYARASFLWKHSERVEQKVYVMENGLVYFEGENISDKLVSIKAEYNVKDPVAGKQSGNHYVGYEIKKNDIKVIGTDGEGNEKEIADFTYSPQILKAGKNDIVVTYTIAENTDIQTHLYVYGDTPALIKMRAEYVGGTLYIGETLDNSDFTVKGIYEDGTEKLINDFSISKINLQEGENTVTILKDGVSLDVEVNAVNKWSITGKEIEPNDEIQNANEIDVNVKYSGNLKDENDVDYYRLRIEKKGKLVIKLTHAKLDDDGDIWVVSLMDQQEDTRVELRSNGKNAETTSSPVRVAAGIYYIKVSDDYYSDEEYSLTALFKEEDDSFETEPNDDLNSQAMPIHLNKKYIGNLTNNQDFDYYKFSIDKKKKIWIDFSHGKISDSNWYWEISLFDDSDGTLLGFYSKGEDGKLTSDCVRLPAGNYYLKINSYDWSDLDYKFCIHAEQEGKDTENENNNDYDTATSINIGTQMIGNIQSNEDVDFYKFNLSNKSTIKISFSHEQRDDSGYFWSIELHSEESSGEIRNNEDQAAIYVEGNSSKTISSTWKSLPKGKYYIIIRGYDYDNSDYTLKVKKQ